MKIKIGDTIKIRRRSKSRNQIHRRGRRGTQRENEKYFWTLHFRGNCALLCVPCGEHYVELAGPGGPAISCYTVIA